MASMSDPTNPSAPSDISLTTPARTPEVLDDPPEAWIGRTIAGKYAITQVIGIGGMGMVFRAQRVLIGDEVALKVLFPRFLSNDLQCTLFKDEAVAAARLSHENCVTVFDTELHRDQGLAYIAMELLEGYPLKRALKERAPMDPAELLPTIIQVCDGLAAAHHAGIVHRDLKPDNIFIERRRDGSTRVKIVDFGIAAMLDTQRDESRKFMGTLRYMAPEQCRAAAQDHRADLYSLGVILYEALTRRRATGRGINAVMTQTPKPLNRHRPPDKQLPAALCELVQQLLAKDPDQRPQDAAEVRARLAALIAPAPAPRSSVIIAPEPPKKTNQTPKIIGLIVLIMLGVLAYLGMQ